MQNDMGMPMSEHMPVKVKSTPGHLISIEIDNSIFDFDLGESFLTCMSHLKSGTPSSYSKHQNKTCTQYPQ